MRIFVSHSSTQKLFVRALLSHCPKSIDFWIDEKDIRQGADFKDAIDAALDGEYSFCILIVDDQAAQSEWVRYEIDRVLASEQRDARVMLIPIVLSETAWHTIAPIVGLHRNYIRCYDLQEDSIRLAANRLTISIFDWLIDATRVGAKSATGGGDSHAGAYIAAEATFLSAARTLKNAIYPFRQQSPASVADILQRVAQNAPGLFASEAELRKALTDLSHQGYMSGYYFDGEIAFLVKERFHDKTSMQIQTKHRIAKAAVQLVSDDQSIALDGGTTTLAIASELCIRLGAGALFGIRIFTNSIPVAEMFMEALALKNASDRDATCRVELLGGVCRASSMCTTDETGDVAALVARLGPLDLSFIGASGLVDRDGFGVTNLPEVVAKQAFQIAARRAVMVCDATKFDIRQARLTNPPDKAMTIITEHAADAALDGLRDANPSWNQVDVRYCD